MNNLPRLQGCVIAINSSYNIRLYCIRKIKPISCRPKKSNHDIYIEEMKADQLKYNGGKESQMVVKSGMPKALRNIGLSPRQFVEQDPLTEDDRDDFDDTIMHGEEFYDIHYKEMNDRKKFIKKKQTIRKYFRGPPETNLLTVAAKEQIKYLHNLDPVVWDAEKLSQSFPISIDGVKKLLRSRFEPQLAERQQSHDKSVARNIKLLKEGKEGISSTTQKLFEEGKLKLEYSIGNVNLPMPNNNKTEKSLQLQTKQYPEKVGQFLCIVKPYLDLKEKEMLANPKSQLTVNENCQSHKENLWKVTVKTPPKYNNEEYSDDPLCASYLSHKVNESNPDVTFESMQKNVVENNKSSLDDCNQKQTCNTAIEPVNPSNFINGNIPKYKSEIVELILDSKDGISDMEPYLYDSKVGYQYPLGKLPEYPNKINIPHNLYKPGYKYKVGNYYYDDDGNFLYRTFV